MVQLNSNMYLVYFDANFEKIKETPEFKYAIQRIEKDIAYEASRGIFI